jgi:hypothetical protein
MKKSKANATEVVAIEEVVTVEEIVVTEPTVTVVAEVKQAKRRGRPIVEGCVRQLKFSAQAERLANGLEVKRGRPVVDGCARQIVLQAREAKRVAGFAIKPGRPKMIKETAVAEVKEAQAV